MKHHHLILIFLLLTTSAAYSQFPNWAWAHSAGNGTNDYGNALTIDKDNMLYCAGQFSSPSITFGNITLTNTSANETNDIFIVKYNPAGEVLWARSTGGTDDDFAKGIATDKFGNVYITGGFTSRHIGFGKDTLTNAGQAGTNDAFIAKFSSKGEILWDKAIGGANDDKADYIIADKDNSVYFTGCFGSPKITFQKGDTLYNKNDPSGSSTDIFLAKYNTDGKLVWLKSINGSGTSYDYGYSLATDSHNNVFITGGTYSYELHFDSIAITTDPTALEYEKHTRSLPLKAMLLLDNHELLDTAGMKRIPNKSDKYVSVLPPQRHAPEKIFIAKYSPEGKLLFAESVGGSDDEEGTSIAIDTKDNLFITGRFKSESLTMDSTTLDNNGSHDIYIAKYSNEGKTLWAKSVGGIADDRGNCIITDNFGNAYIMGWFASPKAIFDNNTLTNSGGKGYTDIFIAKYNTYGDALWCENPKGTDSDWCNSAAIDKQGNIFITGGYDSPELYFGNTKLTNTKGKSFFIARINAR